MSVGTDIFFKNDVSNRHYTYNLDNQTLIQ